ncbi:MAG: glycosyltransferase family 2 protein [Roseiflexaceae bacterium]
MMTNNPLYSVVIPVYNSAKIVGLVIERTRAFFALHGLSYEIILVNDGSRDASWSVIATQAAQYPEVTAINLLRNYGQHNAVFAGIHQSRGLHVITLDDDLQNPPEEIIHLIDSMRDGNHDVVFGRFVQKQHSLVRRFGSGMIRQMNNRIFMCPPDIVPTNFRLIRREVVDRMIGYRTAYPYTTGLALMFAQSVGNAWVKHQERHEGKSNYNLVRIISLVLRILFNYSIWPLRLVTMTGFAIASVSFLIGMVLIVRKLFDSIQIEGWTGIMVMLALLNGVIILMLGMLGEYTIRILQQMNSKETYHIKEIVTHDA